MKTPIVSIACASLIASGASAAAPPRTAGSALIGQDVALAVWAHAENRTSCAPLALASDGGVPASPRLADFGGGWGVAFDTARTRSAYGFAGSGLLPQDRDSDAAKRDAVIKQWPYTRDVGRTGKLPRGSFAGYGLEGAGRYSRANPQGRGQKSLAYLRIPGQPCMYNVWSKVSRAHLEKALDSLLLLPASVRAAAPSASDPDVTPFIARLRVPTRTRCTINSERPVPCTMTRDRDGVLTVRIAGKEPLLLSVFPDSARLFAAAGQKNVPIAVRLTPHPGALDCLRSDKRGRSPDQICVGVDTP